MNIGFVSYWFPRGQAYVTRQLISVVKEHTDHNVFLLTRKGHMTHTEGDWALDNMTIGPRNFNIPFNVYKDWILKNNIDIVVFFQNYQFSEIQKIKNMGVKTIGTFMWEAYWRKHVEPTKSSYDLVYVLHPSQIKHMKKIGLNVEYLRWGVHPDLILKQRPIDNNIIKILIPNGHNTPRKNLDLVDFVIRNTKRKDIVFKVMSNKKTDYAYSNVEVVDKKFNNQEDFLYECMDSDLYFIPSLWEGLGFAMYEAHGLRKGIITPDCPPMSDHVLHGKNGILIPAIPGSKAKNGIPKAIFSKEDCLGIINSLEKERCNSFRKKSRLMLKKYAWENTINDFKAILKKI